MNKRFSLSVGINEYPGTGQDLRGCVNDARDWNSLLTSESYEGELLLDAQATYEAIKAGLRELVAKARFGDRIVFTNSSHGSWVPDTSGDETDRRDEVIVCHDFRQGGLLTDDEVHEVFSQRAFGVRALIISDSCNSGTLHKFAGMQQHPIDARPRFLSPTDYLADEALVRAAMVADTETKPNRSLRAQTSRTTTALLSGCADPEFSYDALIQGKYQGAFTHVALATYKQGQSLSAWHRAIRAFPLPSPDFPQSPQLQATSSQKRWTLG